LKSLVATIPKQLSAQGLATHVSIVGINARNCVMSKTILTTKSICARKLAVGIKLIANWIISAGRNVTKTVIFVPSRSTVNYLVVILKWLNVI
jgi:hypothetical protein